MQRLIGQGKDSGLYSMSNKTTLKHFGGGHQDSQMSKISLWLQQKERKQRTLTGSSGMDGRIMLVFKCL